MHTDTPGRILALVDPNPWRVVVVRAWPHDGGVAAVLLVAEPGSGVPARRIAAASVEAACAALDAFLRELTENQTGSQTVD